MKLIPTFQEFIDNLEKQENDKKAADELKRFKELAGLEQSDVFSGDYFIQITINTPTNLLLEHQQYTQFKKTTNRYTYHPENPSIPVKAHYHIAPSNSKEELYAVNVEDGKAHHKSNRGHSVPRKEADELRSLGVKIPSDNLLESQKLIINESNSDSILTAFILISSED